MVIYADVLFLINFCMDLVSIKLTFGVRSRKIPFSRVTAASVLGAAGGVFQVVSGMGSLASVLFAILLSFLMVVICVGFGAGAVSVVRTTAILWGVGSLLAGGVTLVCSAGNAVSPVTDKGTSSFFVLGVGTFFVAALLRVFKSGRAAPSCTVRFDLFGREHTASALTDSGNLARDPVSGSPVIFIRKAVFDDEEKVMIESLTSEVNSLDHLPPDVRRRVRMISLGTGGELKMKVGLIPLSVDIITKSGAQSVNVIAVCEDTPGYGEFDALIPSSLCV